MDRAYDVAIICFNEPHFSPYVYPYLRILGRSGVRSKVIYWKRGKQEYDYSQMHSERIDIQLADDTPKPKKMLAFLRWRKAVARIIRRDKPRKLIILTTLPGILLLPILLFSRARYILDIRDYTIEGNPALRLLEAVLIARSDTTVISSEGFRAFLPEHPYVVTHNISMDMLDKECEAVSQPEGKKIVIAYVGVVAYARQNEQVIRRFSGDGRFKVEFWGEGPALKQLKALAIELGGGNIDFMGPYSNDGKQEIIDVIDVLLNLYGTDNNARYLLSNKLYDAAFSKKPIICSSGSYMAEIAGRYKIGIIVDSTIHQ